MKKTIILASSAVAALAFGVVTATNLSTTSIQSVNGAYVSGTHTLTIDETHNAPTSGTVYNITDSSMNLHTGGYVVADDGSYSTGTSSYYANNVYGSNGYAVGIVGGITRTYIQFDVFANNISKFRCTFGTTSSDALDCRYTMYKTPYGQGNTSTGTKMSVFANGVETTVTPTSGETVNGINIFLVVASTTAINVGIVSLVVTFSC